MKFKTISVVLRRANPFHVYSGVARMSFDMMDEIGVTTGDVIEIFGKISTVAICKPHLVWAEYKKSIHLDEIVQKNTGAKIGDIVIVRKIRPTTASKIHVISLNDVPKDSERYLRDFLEDHAVSKGDEISLPFFEKTLDYHIEKIIPNSVCAIITNNTVFHIDVVI